MSLSFKPRDLAPGGGLIDDVDVTFRNCHFRFFHYPEGGNGKIPPAFVAELEGADGESVEQVWTCGDHTKVAPSEDGKTAVQHPLETRAQYLVALGEKGLTVTSNFGMLITSLVAAGFPEDEISDRADGLDGLKVHVVRKERPAFKGKSNNDPFKQGGDQKAAEVLVISAILERPGGKKVAKPATKAATPAKATEKAAEPEAGDLAAEVQGHLLALLTSDKYKDKGLPKSAVATEIFALVKSQKNATDIMKLCIKDDILKNGPWTYENGVLKLG